MINVYVPDKPVDVAELAEHFERAPYPVTKRWISRMLLQQVLLSDGEWKHELIPGQHLGTDAIHTTRDTAVVPMPTQGFINSFIARGTYSWSLDPEVPAEPNQPNTGIEIAEYYDTNTLVVLQGSSDNTERKMATFAITATPLEEFLDREIAVQLAAY